jgi:hypothetical protein
MKLDLVSRNSIDSYIVDHRPEGHPDPWLDPTGKEYSYLLVFQGIGKGGYSRIPEINEDVSVNYKEGTKIVILKGQIDKSNERIHMIIRYLNELKVDYRHKMVPEKVLWTIGLVHADLLQRQGPLCDVYYDAFFLFPDGKE